MQIENGCVIVRGNRQCGFGHSAELEAFRDEAKIIPHAEFEMRRVEEGPSGYHEIGFNRGSAIDGLEFRQGKSGIRYLMAPCGASSQYVYADESSLPAG